MENTGRHVSSLFHWNVRTNSHKKTKSLLSSRFSSFDLCCVDFSIFRFVYSVCMCVCVGVAKIDEKNWCWWLQSTKADVVELCTPSQQTNTHTMPIQIEWWQTAPSWRPTHNLRYRNQASVQCIFLKSHLFVAYAWCLRKNCSSFVLYYCNNS